MSSNNNGPSVEDIATSYKIKETSVRVLQELVDERKLPEAYALRSRGLSIDRVVEFVSAVEHPIITFGSLVGSGNASNDPNSVLETYLDKVDAEREDGDGQFNPLPALKGDEVIAFSNLQDVPPKIAQDLGIGYRNDPFKSSHGPEHYATRRES